jgi:hypothetical protein
MPGLIKPVAPEAPAADSAATESAADEPSFDDVFAEITSPPEPESTAKSDAEVEDELDAKAKETAAAAAPETDDAGTESATGDQAESADAADAEAEPDAAALKAQVAELQAKLAGKAAPAEPQEPAAPAADAEPAAIVPLEFSDEERAVLDEYEKEWGDISKAEALKRRHAIDFAVKYVFREVQRVYNPLLRMALQTTENVSEQNAVNAIRSAHQDYNDAVREKVIAWAEGLPGFRKKVAMATIAEGETGDVVDLITEWKQATGQIKPRVVVGAKTDSTPAKLLSDKPAPLSAKANQAAKSIAARTSKRTATGVDAPDPNDFDAAFAEALKASTK